MLRAVGLVLKGKEGGAKTPLTRLTQKSTKLNNIVYVA